MATDGSEVPMEEEAAAPEVEAAAPPVEKMDPMTALQKVLKAALMHDGLARGLHEAAKALDKRQAQLCVLAKDCDEKSYEKLVEALCTHHSIHLIRVESKLQLGEWAGLCKIDKEGTARKIVGCSCVVVKYGEESYGPEASAALEVLLSHAKSGDSE